MLFHGLVHHGTPPNVSERRRRALQFHYLPASARAISESERLAVNARLHWIPRPGVDAYLVWNSTWPTGLAGGVPWERPLRGALVGKFVYYFRV